MNKQKNDSSLRRFLEFIRNDIARILITVFFAAIVYAIVYNNLPGKQTYEYRIENIPVAINLPETGKLTFINPEETVYYVSVNVKTPSRSAPSRSSFSASKNISLDQFKKAQKTKTKEYAVSVSDVSCTDKDVEILSVSPVTVELDEIITKPGIPITVDWDLNDMLPGYSVAGSDFPAGQNISLTGPSLLVRGIKDIRTEKIPVSKATQDFSYVVKLIRPGSNAKITMPESVMVKVLIKKPAPPAPKVFKDLPVLLLTLPRFANQELTVELNPPSVTVVVEGNERINTLITKDIVHPYIDISNFEQPGDYQASVKCWSDLLNTFGKDISIKTINPVTVKVILRKKNEK